MKQPVILCGLGQVGRRVLDYLHKAGAPVIVIDNRCTPEELRLDGVRLIQGDFRQREVLAQAGLEKARGVLILTSDDLVNISAALMVRSLDPNVRVVVRLFNQNLIPRLGQAVANMYALSVSLLTAPLLALTAITGQALAAFTLGGERYQIAEFTVQETSRLRADSVAGIAGRYGALVLAHFPARGESRFMLDVDAEARVAPADRLVVCGQPQALTPLLEQLGEEALPDLRWAGAIRRFGRVVWQALAEIDLSVKICTTVLVTVVTASTLVYSLGMNKTVPDGLFRTISVIATGADMHEKELPEGWQKVFVSFMRIMGAALIASFTAIITNYLLRARLRGVFEVRRIPDSGHVIVCGLGNVGFRLVEELLQHGQRVVVIESQRDGRFMPAARRQAVAIIVGDATVLEVLRQAHAAKARAVVAATSNELVNLEIALLTRELNPKQRVVVRLNDPHFSDTLREAANIKFAVSIPTLAAPAFVAALFGDRVLTIFLLKGRLMAVIELIVQADDPLLAGQIVRALAIDYRFLPVILRNADRQMRPQPMNHRLGVGDRLTVVTALSDLVRLQRRERVPADCDVEVTGFNLPARPLVLQLLREQRGLTPEAAETALAHLPLCVGTRLTRGQAEDLLVTLGREGVKARLRDELPLNPAP
jgi:Trk K+ transport system NAD-binding subunit